MPNRLTFSRAYEFRLNLDADTTSKILQMYQEISEDIGRQIASLEGIETKTAGYQLQFMTDLQTSLNKEFEILGKTIEQQIKNDIGATIDSVFQDNIDWAKQFSLNIGISTATVKTDIIASVLNGKLYDPLPDGTNWTLSKAIWNTTEETQQTIQRIIAEGIARNDSALDIARNLEYFVDPEHRKEFDLDKIYPGARGSVDYNAFRLARTAVTHAYQQSIVRSVEKNPFVEGLLWHTAHDHRVCEICIEYEETDHHGLGIGIFPKDDVPLDHPNGRCTLIPEMVSMDVVADAIANWINGVEDGYTEGLNEYSKYF